jgi:parallel beta-helix repeat protein
MFHGIYMRASNSSTVADNICNGNFFYGVFMHTCESSSVIDNVCNEDPQAGIYVYNCSSNIVSGNTCKDSDFGMYFEAQGSHNITYNLCENNTNMGIAFHDCDLNTVANNTSIDNGNYGVALFMNSDNNDVLWNALVNNSGADGYDQDVGNVFSYNYYSDYVGTDANQDHIGDTTHFFQFSSDSTPLMYVPFAPEWAVPLEDQVIELGTEWEYDLPFFILEPSAPYILFVNDSLNFADLDYDTIISRTMLPVGNYPLSVNATNVYGYFTEGAFELSVRDTTPPSITNPDNMIFTVGEYDIPELQWIVHDLSYLSYTILKNGTELTSSSTTSTSLYLSIIVENYLAGVFNYTLVVIDTSGNVGTDMVLVTILPVPFLEAMMPWIILGIAAVAVVIVTVVLLRKRKS